jgi:hypothetical protein
MKLRGDGFIKQLSEDMTAEFPGMKGLSERNLKYMRQWFLFYAGASEFGQQAVAQIAKPSFSKVPDPACRVLKRLRRNCPGKGNLVFFDLIVKPELSNSFAILFLAKC